MLSTAREPVEPWNAQLHLGWPRLGLGLGSIQLLGAGALQDC